MKLASGGGYEAVRMRSVANLAGLSTASIYRYHFPSKADLLVSALVRELRDFENRYAYIQACGNRQKRMAMLIEELHCEWQRDIYITDALARAFVVGSDSQLTTMRQAEGGLRALVARTLSGGCPSQFDDQISGLIADILIANIVSFVCQRKSADTIRSRIDRSIELLLQSEIGLDRRF